MKLPLLKAIMHPYRSKLWWHFSLHMHISLLFVDSLKVEDYSVCILLSIIPPKVTTDWCDKHLFPPLYSHQTPELPLVPLASQPSPYPNNGWVLRLSPISNIHRDHSPGYQVVINAASFGWRRLRDLKTSLRHACTICSGSLPADLHCHTWSTSCRCL